MVILPPDSQKILPKSRFFAFPRYGGGGTLGNGHDGGGAEKGLGPEVR